MKNNEKLNKEREAFFHVGEPPTPSVVFRDKFDEERRARKASGNPMSEDELAKGLDEAVRLWNAEDERRWIRGQRRGRVLG